MSPRLADVVWLLVGDDPFDLVVGMAARRADVLLLMPAGNVGNASFFFPPVLWWMTERMRSPNGLFADAASRTGSVYVNLFHERAAGTFVADRALNARDGPHPSDVGSRVWMKELMAQADLARRLSRAAEG